MSDTELSAKIDALVATYGHHKVNLIHHGDGNEGVWVVSASEEDHAIYKSGGTEQKYKARLCNQPLGWAGKRWGDEIVAVTQGDIRPIARIADQDS